MNIKALKVLFSFLIIFCMVLGLTSCKEKESEKISDGSQINTSSQVNDTSSNDSSTIEENTSSEESTSKLESSFKTESSKIETSSKNTSSTNKTESKQETSSSTPITDKVWEYKNGGIDHIIKTDGKTTIKIPINVSKYEIPENTTTHTYEVEIERSAFKKVNDWVYFFEVYVLHRYYKSDNPAWDAAGAYTTSTRDLYRMKEDGSSMERIPESINERDDGEPSNWDCNLVIGYVGSDMYFIKNYGYMLGGYISKVTVTDDMTYFVDKATVFDYLIPYLPGDAYIKNDKIYLFGIEEPSDSLVIPISELKVK